jgi:hypothetical protein
MTISNNLLISCLKIHNISISDIARLTDFSPSYVQKIIAATTYHTKKGLKVRHNAKVKAAIAHSIGLTYEQTWGNDSAQHLRRAIEYALTKQEFNFSLKQRDS